MGYDFNILILFWGSPEDGQNMWGAQKCYTGCVHGNLGAQFQSAISYFFPVKKTDL